MSRVGSTFLPVMPFLDSFSSWPCHGSQRVPDICSLIEETRRLVLMVRTVLCQPAANSTSPPTTLSSGHFSYKKHILDRNHYQVLILFFDFYVQLWDACEAVRSRVASWMRSCKNRPKPKEWGRATPGSFLLIALYAGSSSLSWSLAVPCSSVAMTR